MITENNKCFSIHTNNTSYVFRIIETGQPEHLYYGRRIDTSKACYVYPLIEKHEFAPGNTNYYDNDHKKYTLEDMCLELSSYGKGDIREPLALIRYSDGSTTSDFVYDSFQIDNQKEEFDTLPGSFGDNVEHLSVVYKEIYHNIRLVMNYYVYEDCDCITREVQLINDSDETVKIEKLYSMQLDFEPGDYNFTTFNGGWAREMKKNVNPLIAGKHINSSFTGTSSSRANPFVMISNSDTTEDFGDVYAFNLIYSGNHAEVAEVSSFWKVRFLTGVNPECFSYQLKAGEKFETPEAVMTYSCDGFNGMSLHMHKFVNNHIVRGAWANKPRPILLNSWEAAYFDINEKKLVDFAKAGKDVGIELFVMDDGWFGNRNDDTSSLGDWYANTKKLPKGVKGISEKIKALGMDFGIWVEPEMVNVNSELYKNHPDWVMDIPDQNHSEGRNQRILDLCNPEVQDYVIESMTKVFSSGEISYVKWDMNRTVTDIYSRTLPADRQGEVLHRYCIGLYRCMKELTKRFPEILFEGCSAGGNRFDLGILCYFPQIWASDDTDAVCRAEIQTNYSYGYPLSVISAHVSSTPNHQTLRITPLTTRFNVAAFGACGYECNLCDMKKEELEEIKEQITTYKEWRDVFQLGRFYRGRMFGNDNASVSALRPMNGNTLEWTCVSEDKTKAVSMIMQKLVVPNNQYENIKVKGVDPEKIYHFYNQKKKHNVKNFGDLVNTVAPIHIKQDSFTHNLIAKFVKMDGETEDVTCKGDTLMHSGVKLKQAFAGTGYNDQVRYYQDFGSRMYFMEEVEG